MRTTLTAALTTTMVLTMATLAQADSHLSGAPMPGQNLWDWLLVNVLGAFPVILAVISLWYLVRRAFAAFLSFALFACIVATFIYAPDVVRTFGVSMGRLILR